MPEPPAYKRIEADLRRRIDKGEWPVGGRLPTYQELADEYGVSLAPVRQALTRLEMVGYVRLRMGGRPLVEDRYAKAYERIRADLRRRIESGELKPGMKLPSHPELAEEFGVSVQPVRAALTLLEQVDGLVVSRQGKGVYVVGEASEG